MGGSPGLVITGGDSCCEGRGFESQHSIMDEPYLHIGICGKNCNVWLKRRKRGRRWHQGNFTL